MRLRDAAYRCGQSPTPRPWLPMAPAMTATRSWITAAAASARSAGSSWWKFDIRTAVFERITAGIGLPRHRGALRRDGAPVRRRDRGGKATSAFAEAKKSSRRCCELKARRAEEPASVVDAGRTTFRRPMACASATKSGALRSAKIRPRLHGRHATDVHPHDRRLHRVHEPDRARDHVLHRCGQADVQERQDCHKAARKPRYRRASATNLSDLDATAQAELVRRGDASPRELVDAAIARIEKHNPALGAVIIPLFEQARATADDAPHGPFRGVPILIKDIIATVGGVLYTAGLKPLREANYTSPQRQLPRRPRCAAPASSIVGKTNTSEFGIVPSAEPPAWPPARNPYDTTRSTGGSSGGSAAAVAAGMVPIAHANDGGGSIRIPASCCGLFGLKPSRGRVSFAPNYGDVNGGLVNEHVVARSVRDSAAILDILAGMQPGDPYTAPPQLAPYAPRSACRRGKLRIALRDPAHHARRRRSSSRIPIASPPSQHTAKLLESLGHHVEHAEIEATRNPDWVPTSSRSGRSASRTARSARRAASAARSRARGRAADVGPRGARPPRQRRRVRRGLGAGSTAPRAAIADVLQPLRPLADAHGDRAARSARHVQVAARRHPRRHLRAGDFAPFTPLFNATGQPACSLPLYRNAAGLPIGVQLVAAYGREDLLFRIAAQLEAAQPFDARGDPASSWSRRARLRRRCQRREHFAQLVSARESRLRTVFSFDLEDRRDVCHRPL